MSAVHCETASRGAETVRLQCADLRRTRGIGHVQHMEPSAAFQHIGAPLIGIDGDRRDDTRHDELTHLHRTRAVRQVEHLDARAEPEEDILPQDGDGARLAAELPEAVEVRSRRIGRAVLVAWLMTSGRVSATTSPASRSASTAPMAPAATLLTAPPIRPTMGVSTAVRAAGAAGPAAEARIPVAAGTLVVPVRATRTEPIRSVGIA